MQIDTAGTYTLKYTAEDECGNVTEVTREVVAEAPPVYGVYWDGGSSPLWTRTDAAVGFADPIAAVANGDGSSPFDDIMPWSGMEIVEDAVAGTLVKIPKYWYKWTEDGASLKLQITNAPQNGFLVSPAHADRGDGNGERDFVYVGRYHCDSSYKSTRGVLPKKGGMRSEFRQGIHNLGSDIWQFDVAMYGTITMLYLVEYATWNSQASIGGGCGNNSLMQEGLTDAMIYHTGTAAATRESYGAVQYRHIEGLWSNPSDFCDGITFVNRDAYGIKNPADFEDDANGVLLGTAANTDGYARKLFIPSEEGFSYPLFVKHETNIQNGTANTYVTDVFLPPNITGVYVALVGGSRWGAGDYGLFFIDTHNAASTSVGESCGRVQKLPSA